MHLLHRCWVTGCGGEYSAKSCPLQRISELQWVHTPLRRSAFERELKGHPNKAWVSWLLNGIDNGVATGYNSPHFPFTARNLTSALQHPEIIDDGISMFIAPEWKDADSFQLYTNASSSFGFGAYLDGAWFRGDWQPHQQLPKCPIQWQELFAIVAAALTWGHLLAGQRIRFPCDNLPIVQAWTNQSSRHPGVMELLRTLFFIAARNSFTVSLVHLPGRLNCIADVLSPQSNVTYTFLTFEHGELGRNLAPSQM